MGPYTIVNPRAYELFRDHPEIDDSWPGFVHAGSVFKRTKAFAVATDAPESDDLAPPEAFALIARFLNRLRYLSRQATIPFEVYSITGPIDGSVLTREPIPALGATRVTIRAHLLEWAATEEHVRSAVSTINAPIPIHHELLLDSQRAAINSDYRTAILFAAIACETLAGISADLHHGGKDAADADPVFKFLRARAKFANLLHEVDLHCRGSSLRLVDEPLYQRALRLYGTRNKIAHEGLPPENGNFLPISTEGAQEAINTAVALFAWFGEAGGYTDTLRLELVQAE